MGASVLTFNMILAIAGHRLLTNIPMETGITRATNEIPGKRKVGYIGEDCQEKRIAILSITDLYF